MDRLCLTIFHKRRPDESQISSTWMVELVTSGGMLWFASQERGGKADGSDTGRGGGEEGVQVVTALVGPTVIQWYDGEWLETTFRLLGRVL